MDGAGDGINATLNDFPTLKDLNNHVREVVMVEWYDLGVQLDLEDKLDEIKANNPTSKKECCTEMFKRWRRSDRNASWRKLIEALKAPSLGLHELAQTLCLKLKPEDQPQQSVTSQKDVTDLTGELSSSQVQQAALHNVKKHTPYLAGFESQPQSPVIPEGVSSPIQDSSGSTSGTKSVLQIKEDILLSLNLCRSEDQEQSSSPPKKQKSDDAEFSELLANPINFEICLENNTTIRQYQRELATPGLQGKNCIIVAPTGTGKTLVACIIICDNLNRHGRNGKVLFLVPKIPLANQHCEEIKCRINGATVMQVTGDSGSSFSLSTLLTTHDIVVCTADLLKNDLYSKSVLLKDITLIVFDECHHCKGRSPYASIMIEYLKMKRKGETQLPQIIGLTASPGAGDSRKPDFNRTIDHLMTLGAMMDADAGFITVKENLVELQRFTTKTQYKVVPIPGRRISDDFQTLLLKYIKKLDNVIQKVTGKLAAQGFSEQGYMNHLSALLRESKLRSDAEKERNVRAIIEHLQHYTKILQFYFDYEYEDSLSVMRNKLRLPRKEKATEVESQLQEMLETFYQDVQLVKSSTNPKLNRLKELLIENFQGSANNRAIVFVTEVNNAVKMKEWILRQPELNRCVQAGVVTGHGKHEFKGMTQEEQNAVIKDFREGKLNLLVATSVLEEGIDIPACNLIIRYQHVTNEIALIQSKGRARATDSKCYAIIGKGTPKEFQEIQNEEKNHLVTTAIENHLQPISKWISKLHAIQTTCLDKAEREEKLAEEQKKLHKIEDIQILCGTCDSFVCHGKDLRRIYTQHVVISEDIYSKYTRKEHEKPFIRGGTEMKYRIHCNECDHPWGVETVWPKVGRALPCLGCDKFVFVTRDGRDTFKKWKDVTFSVPEM